MFKQEMTNYKEYTKSEWLTFLTDKIKSHPYGYKIGRKYLHLIDERNGEPIESFKIIFMNEFKELIKK